MGIYNTGLNTEKQYIKKLLQKKHLNKSKILIIGNSSLRLAKNINIIQEDSTFIKEKGENTTTDFRDISQFEDITNIPIANKYDLIILLELLAKDQRPKEYLSSCYNILKEEGCMLISVPNVNNSYWEKQESKDKLIISDNIRWKANFDVNSLIIEKKFTMGIQKNASTSTVISQILQCKFNIFLNKNLYQFYFLRKSKEGCRRNPDFIK